MNRRPEMSSRSSKDSLDVVELSSDDEDAIQDDIGDELCSNDRGEPEQDVALAGPQSPQSTSNHRRIELQSFWKAGHYDSAVSKPTTSLQGELEYLRVHPKFLHSNATSHKWAFGAIAELLDNAVDEISNGATFVRVDRIYNMRDNSPALLFQDNGGGMDPECMRRCMSLGYSTKKSSTTIGQYGNGFKTSTMRLGADAIVFSRTGRSHATQSIGFLSYTFLRSTGQDDIIVPIIDFEISENHAQPIIHGSQDNWNNNLNIILEWSPFATKDELMEQFNDIGLHGTKVLVYNLWLNDDDALELDFEDDDEDIRLRDEAKCEGSSKRSKGVVLQSHISYRFRYSLRAYASILYLRKFSNFEIILRNKPVEQFNIADGLQFSKVVKYRPNLGVAPNEVLVEATIGFVKEAPLLNIQGFNVYHKNRLIMPFWKVIHESSSRGSSVVGILEANFMEPAHDKQDFERTAVFLRMEMKLKQMTFDYWKAHCHLIGFQTPGKSRTNDLQQDLPSVQPVVRHRARNAKISSFQQELASVQTAVGVAATSVDINSFQQELPYVPTIVGLAARSSQDFPTVIGLAERNDDTHGLEPELPSVHTVGLAAANGINSDIPIMSSQSAFYSELSVEHDQNQTDKEEEAFVSTADSTLLDKISDENIELFLRCEQFRKKETELNETIEKLENELKEARKKCSQLAFSLEIRKKQKNVK